MVPGVELPPASVIPTCVDLKRFVPAPDRGEIRRRLGIGSGPVLIHIGSLSTWYLAELTLLELSSSDSHRWNLRVLTHELDMYYVQPVLDRRLWPGTVGRNGGRRACARPS